MRNFYKTVSSPSKREQVIFFLCLLFLSSFLLHAGFLENKFIDGEDLKQIVQNPLIHNISLIGLAHDFRGFIHFGYPPPAMTYCWGLIYSGWGLNHIGFHFVSFILHTLNTCLLFGLLVFRTKKFFPAFWGAFILAMHPLHCETVNWISKQGLLLAVLFGLSFIFLSAEKGRSSRILSVLSLAIAMLFSPVSILFLPAERMINYKDMPQKEKRWGTVVFLAIFYILNWGWRVSVFSSKSLMTTALSTVYYFVSKLFCPWNVHYLIPSLKPLHFIPVVVSAAVFLLIFYMWLKKRRGFLGLFVLSFLAIWLLHVGETRFNGGFSYPSLLFFSLAAGIGFSMCKIRWFSLRVVIIFLSVALIFFLGFLSYQRNVTWKNTGSLVSDSLRTSPHDPFLSAIYGHYLSAMHAGEKSKVLLERIKSCDVDLLCLKAKAYYLLFNAGKASSLFKRALSSTEIRPEKACIFDYAAVNLQAGNLNKAAGLYRRILREDPYFIYALHNLATIMVREKRNSAGLGFFSKVLKIAPAYRPTLENLAVYYMREGRYKKAAAMVKEVLNRASCHDEKRYYGEWLKFMEKGENFPYAVFKWVNLIPPS